MSSRAQSETVGVILLTGIIVVTVGTAGAVVLSGSGMGSEERVTADVSVSVVDDGVGITHEGGDPVPLSDLRIVVRNGDETWRPAVNASGLKNDDGDDQFEQGERWIGRHTLDTDQITTVRVIDAGSNTVLAEARRYPTQRTELTPTSSEVTDDTTPPSVQVESPDGGETVLGGSDLTITWTASDANTTVDSVDVQYSANGGSSWQTLTAGTTNDGSEVVRVPTESTDDALIRVRAVDAGGNVGVDQSNATFTVDGDQPSVDSIWPNTSAQADIDAEGDGWEDLSVSWTASDPTTSIGTVTISVQNVTTTLSTVETTGASGTVTVPIPNETAEDVYNLEIRVEDDARNIKIREEADAVVVGDGGGPDTTPPGVTVEAPNGGEVFRGGSTTTIQWTSNDADTGVDRVNIAYSTDNGTTWDSVVRNTTNDGAYTWTVPEVNTTDALVRVNATDGAGNTANDTSDGTFVIDSAAPTISPYEVTNPSGGRVNVTFESDEQLADINITISRDGSRVLTLAEGDFSVTGNGPYTYSASYTASQNGDYTATLNVAADEAGNDGAAAESGTVKITGGGGAGQPVIQNFSDFIASSDRDIVTVGNVTAEQFVNGEDLESVEIEVQEQGSTTVIGNTSLPLEKNVDRVSQEDVTIDAPIENGAPYNVTVIATSTNGESTAQSKNVAGEDTQPEGPFIDEFGTVTADSNNDEVAIAVLNVSDDTEVKNVTVVVEEKKQNAEFTQVASTEINVSQQSDSLSPVIDYNVNKNREYRVVVTVWDTDGNSVRQTKTANVS